MDNSYCQAKGKDPTFFVSSCPWGTLLELISLGLVPGMEEHLIHQQAYYEEKGNLKCQSQLLLWTLTSLKGRTALLTMKVEDWVKERSSQ